MATGITFRNAKIEISIDSGINWTNISGQTNSLTVGGGDREIGTFFDAASDVPTLGAGKRAELELVLRVRYTETDAEAQGVLALAYENQTELFVRYSPQGGGDGQYEYTFSAGFVKTNPYPGQEVESGDPLRIEFTIVVPAISSMIIDIFGSSLIAYWPFSEPSGTVAIDVTGNARHGEYTGTLDLSNTTSPIGKPAPLFATGDVDVYSTSLASAFNKSEGSIGGFVKMVDSGVWTDASIRYLFIINSNPSNQVYLRKQIVDNTLLFNYVAGGVTKQALPCLENTGWTHFIISWSIAADEGILYVNGAPAATITGLGTWSGDAVSTNNTRIGGASDGTLYLHNGWMSDVFVLNRPVTAEEARRAATSHVRPKIITTLGDSITAIQSNLQKWPDKLANLNYNNGYVGIINRAVAGNSIISHMDAQTAAAASDNADIIILHFGTNDNNAGDMGVLQAEVEENIAELKVSNPNAVIYYMNVLPRWTDNTGAVEDDKSNIRTAIAAACVAQNITCWDTYTVPWITAAQTTDGVHPTTPAGYAAVAAEVVARL